MRVVSEINRLAPDTASVVTVGTYDGIHRGHVELLDIVHKMGHQLNLASTVVTFDPHPSELLLGKRIALLSSQDERIARCKNLGLDRFVSLPFDDAMASLSGEEFVRDILIKRIGMKHIVIGYDHVFGRSRSGNAHLLKTLGPDLGFGVTVVPAVSQDERAISSTDIRRLLAEDGDVEKAGRYLGYRYGFFASVIRGVGRGRSIGFPTANLDLEEKRKVVPASGVYSVIVRVENDDHSYIGMMNIGKRPTFENEGQHLEVHLLDFDSDLYDTGVHLEFVTRVRDEIKFKGVEQLVMQLKRDRERCTTIVQKVLYDEREIHVRTN